MLTPLKRKLAQKKSPYKSPYKSPRKNKSFNSPLLQKALIKKRTSRVSLLFQKVDEDARKRPLNFCENDADENKDHIPLKRSRRLSSPERVKSQHLPQDLRIGSKLIVKSSVPFTFTPTNAQITYEHVVRLNKTAAQEYLRNPNSSTNPEVILQAACLYWKYPFSTIIKSPRIEGNSGILRTEKRAYNPISKETVEITAILWQDAFEDLYTQWRDYSLTSFYVCASNFTVLFIKSVKAEVTTAEGTDPGETSCMGFSEFTQYKAIITPSSRSLRKLLDDSEIDYTKVFSGHTDINESMLSMNDSLTQDSLDASILSLQNLRGERAKTPDQSFEYLKPLNAEEEYVSPMKLGEDVANDDFLRKIGLSPSVMVKCETRDSQSCSQFSLECNSQDSLQRAAGSTVVISDLSSIDNFRSLLCNNKTGWVRSGPEAGLPPILLSTQQFINATLTSLEIRTQKLRKDKHQYVMEIQNGPILPHLSQSVWEYLDKSGQFNGDNVVQFHVNGRAVYDGINEGFSDEMKNINNFFYNSKGLQFEY